MKRPIGMQSVTVVTGRLRNIVNISARSHGNVRPGRPSTKTPPLGLDPCPLLVNRGEWTSPQ
jgi:hypothetical protein